MDKKYAVLDTALNQFVAIGATDKRSAKAEATRLNAARKPEFQTYTVVTVVFDPEV